MEEPTTGKRPLDEADQAQPQAKKAKANPSNERCCAQCGQGKPLKSYSQKQKKKGALAKCKDCTAENNAFYTVSPNGEAAMLVCKTCKEPKDRTVFHIQSKKKAKCLACHEKEMALENERKKQYAERARIQALERAERQQKKQLAKDEFLQSLPPQRKMPTFECPLETNDDDCFSGSDSETEEEKRLTLQCERISSAESLAGDHELLFFFAEADEGCEFTRATVGSVVFVKDDAITGTVLIDKSVKFDLEQQWPDWELQVKDNGHEFEITNMDHPLQHVDVAELHDDPSAKDPSTSLRNPWCSALP